MEKDTLDSIAAMTTGDIYSLIIKCEKTDMCGDCPMIKIEDCYCKLKEALKERLKLE
jgi:hypothetical protein